MPEQPDTMLRCLGQSGAAVCDTCLRRISRAEAESMRTAPTMVAPAVDLAGACANEWHERDANYPWPAVPAVAATEKPAERAPTNAEKIMGECIHDLVVGMQAAWIEWRHGGGAEAGMRWIEGALWGPGHIPDERAPYGKEAQAWYDEHKSHPFPRCFCGRPSNIAQAGLGWCSEAHRKERPAPIGGAR